MKRPLSALALGKTLAAGWAWGAESAPVLSEWGGVKDLAWAGASLVLVLLALMLLLKALKRFGRFRKTGPGALFEMRGYQALDNRKYLAAVAVDGRMLIIGVTPDRLIPLGQWPLLDGMEDMFAPPENAPPDRGAAGPGEAGR
jgi:flagellar biogenesis protein FliO